MQKFIEQFDQLFNELWLVRLLYKFYDFNFDYMFVKKFQSNTNILNKNIIVKIE